MKEIIRKKSPNELIDPDDLLAEKLIKTFAIFSLMIIIVSLIEKVLLGDTSVTSSLGIIGSTTFTLFFMMLFMHLNNKSSNPSYIMYGLTFLSAMIPIWI